jgi:hypothetical protein
MEKMIGNKISMVSRISGAFLNTFPQIKFSIRLMSIDVCRLMTSYVFQAAYKLLLLLHWNIA